MTNFNYYYKINGRFISKQDNIEMVGKLLNIEASKIRAVLDYQMANNEFDIETELVLIDLTKEDYKKIMNFLNFLTSKMTQQFMISSSEIEHLYSEFEKSQRVLPEIDDVGLSAVVREKVQENGSYVVYEAPNELQATTFGLTSVPKTKYFEKNYTNEAVIDTDQVLHVLQQIFAKNDYISFDLDFMAELLAEIKRMKIQDTLNKLRRGEVPFWFVKDDIERFSYLVSLLISKFNKIFTDFEQSNPQVLLYSESQRDEQYGRDDCKTTILTTTEYDYNEIKNGILRKLDILAEQNEKMADFVIQGANYSQDIVPDVQDVDLDTNIILNYEVFDANLTEEERIIKNFKNYLYTIFKYRNYNSPSYQDDYQLITSILKELITKVVGIFQKEDLKDQLLAQRDIALLPFTYSDFDNMVNDGIASKEDIMQIVDYFRVLAYCTYVQGEEDEDVVDDFERTIASLNEICSHEIGFDFCELASEVVLEHLESLLNDDENFEIIADYCDDCGLKLPKEKVKMLKKADLIDDDLVRQIYDLGGTKYKMSSLKNAISGLVPKLTGKGKKKTPNK